MLLIEKLDGSRVVKYCENLGEMNSVLAMVLLSLVFIPFKRQISLYTHMCVFLKRIPSRGLSLGSHGGLRAEYERVARKRLLWAFVRWTDPGGEILLAQRTASHFKVGGALFA